MWRLLESTSNYFFSFARFKYNQKQSKSEIIKQCAKNIGNLGEIEDISMFILRNHEMLSSWNLSQIRADLSSSLLIEKSIFTCEIIRKATSSPWMQVGYLISDRADNENGAREYIQLRKRKFPYGLVPSESNLASI